MAAKKEIRKCERLTFGWFMRQLMTLQWSVKQEHNQLARAGFLDGGDTSAAGLCPKLAEVETLVDTLTINSC